jgi:hypothetical protein
MALNIEEKDGKKYIDGEEILCEYELDINIYKIIIFIFGLFIFFFYAKSKDYDVGISYMIFLVLLLIFFGVIILRNIQNVYKNRIYVTQNYIINASGKVYKTDNIYFTYVNVVTGFLSQNELFFYNGNKFNFIFFGEVNEDNENFKKLIQTLYDISNNENILVENMNFSKSRQKLIKGECKKGDRHLFEKITK